MLWWQDGRNPRTSSDILVCMKWKYLRPLIDILLPIKSQSLHQTELKCAEKQMSSFSQVTNNSVMKWRRSESLRDRLQSRSRVGGRLIAQCVTHCDCSRCEVALIPRWSRSLEPDPPPFDPLAPSMSPSSVRHCSVHHCGWFPRCLRWVYNRLFTFNWKHNVPRISSDICRLLT